MATIGAQRLGAARAAIVEIMRRRTLGPAGLRDAFAAIMSESMRALAVDRVGLWEVGANGELTCRTILGARAPLPIPTAPLRDVPTYLRALETLDVVAITDLAVDPRAVELRGYGVATGVGALIDVPISRDGRLAMVICHEHVGGPRVWSEEERGFAVVVAALLSLALETERRVRNEQALAGAEARYRHLVERLPCVVYAFDFRTAVLDYVSPNAVTLGGWPADRWIAAGTAEAWIARIDPDHRAAVLARFDASIAATEPPELTYRVALPDGSARWIRDACTVVRDPLGAPIAIQGTLTDVTSAKHAEIAVGEHQRRFEELFATVDLLGVLVDGDGRVVRVNDACAAALGRPAEQLVGAVWNDVALPATDRATAATHPTGRVLGRIQRADGEIRLVDWTHTATRDATGAIDRVASLGVDLSRRAAVEAAVLRDARFETLGRVAAVVAHDLANLITILDSTIDELASTSDAATTLLDPLRQVGLRARGMMQMIRSAGSAEDERVATRCDQLVRDNARIWRLMARGRASFELAAEVDAPALVDPGSLVHLVANLVGNALDATPASGTVRVSVERARVDGDLAGRHEVAPGDFVVIAVSDTGSGIAPEVQARIFEPFFTTKVHGSGLGLAGARGIAKRHGGFVTLDSEVGRGTTIRVFLPALVEEAAPRTAAGPW